MVTTYGDAPNRVLAFGIDAVLLSAIIAFVAAIVSTVADAAGAYAVVSIVVAAGYFVGSWLTLAGSPGMRLLGMRLGARISARDAVVRWALLVLPFGVAGSARVVVSSGAAVAAVLVVAVAWYALLFVTTVRSETKQGIHDRLAHTTVTKQPIVADAG